MKKEASHNNGMLLRDFILGGQDGLVNVLGLLLGVATATQDTRIIFISGISALFAESISMGAVAFTSSKAARDYYEHELRRERREIRETPFREVKEVRTIYARKGLRGAMLDAIVRRITSNKTLWLQTMMVEELRLYPDQYEHPVRIGVTVLFATVLGSLVPLLPYFFLPVGSATLAAVGVSGLVLFLAGAVKARLTIGSWYRSGTEMMLIGLLAAIVGYVIGEVLRLVF